jgi:hypothetical protein
VNSSFVITSVDVKTTFNVQSKHSIHGPSSGPVNPTEHEHTMLGVTRSEFSGQVVGVVLGALVVLATGVVVTTGCGVVEVVITDCGVVEVVVVGSGMMDVVVVASGITDVVVVGSCV